MISSLGFWLWFECSFPPLSPQPETRAPIWVKGNPHACTNTTIIMQLSSFFCGLFLTQFSSLLQFMACKQPSQHGQGWAATAAPTHHGAGNPKASTASQAQMQRLPSQARCCHRGGLAFLLSPDSAVPPPPFAGVGNCLANSGLASQLREGSSTSRTDRACWSGSTYPPHHSIFTIEPYPQIPI